MPRIQSKAKKRMIVVSFLAAGVAAVGVGTALSASAAGIVTGHGSSHGAAYYDAVLQCKAMGSQSGGELGFRQQRDGSWTVTMTCG
ncbi:MAG TPA: hypothetical protein VI248_19050 [Kineosporiaceae bacterium]